MKNILFLLFTLLVLAVPAVGQDGVATVDKPSVFEDFHQPGSLATITLQTDWKRFFKKQYRKEKQDARITYQNAEGTLVSRDITLNARGNSRLEICSFPPIKLHFKKSELEKEGFIAPFNDLKVVTHCNSSVRSEQQILREFLTYELYNTISPISYRVQLANIQYLNEDGELYAEKSAFLIEDTDALAYRLAAKESERFNLESGDLDTQTYCRLLLFEYMIGNTDWNLKALHNLKIIKRFADETLLPIPYDFDYAGLVNAYYAVPNERISQRFVKHRVLMDEFPNQYWMQQTLQEFQLAKDKLFATCETFLYLEEHHKKDMLTYLESFFERIDDPNVLSRGL